MRGLTDGAGSGGRTLATSGAATAGLVAAALFAAGCSTGGTGVQDEGVVPSSAAAKATPSPLGPPGGKDEFTGAVDAVQLLKNDPKVSARVKADLQRCAGDQFPVDTSYGVITAGTAPDVVINVMTCGDAVGMGTYVYRGTGKTYENVFILEEPSVYAVIDRGDLVVTRQVYDKGDPVADPSAEEVTTYRWSAGKFTRQFWVRNEFSRSVGEGEELPTDLPLPSEN
ncbi:hypothetical protein OHS70_16150 [Streptomyces sp. NBC_00390]|uniref:hypothetical protein n=1 Tax=Streptomyces sp. NBC_00390 TaxID=2975736 RepID=UPI002E1B7511